MNKLMEGVAEKPQVKNKRENPDQNKGKFFDDKYVCS